MAIDKIENRSNAFKLLFSLLKFKIRKKGSVSMRLNQKLFFNSWLKT